MRVAAALVAGLAALALAACGDDDEATSSAAPATSGTTTTAEQEATTVDIDDSAGSRMVAIYLERDGRVYPVRRLVGSGRPELGPVLEQLLAGPTPEESAAGYTTAIPPGVQLLGVRQAAPDLVAVDLSVEFGKADKLALAQVVHTVTQEVGPSMGVSFELIGLTAGGFPGEAAPADGRWTVADVEDVTPPVLVQWPLPGDQAKCPQRVTGTSNTFEATSLLGFTATTDELPSGDPTIVTASSGNGTRGSFDVSVPCPDAGGETAYLASWFASAKDGSPQAVEHIPLRFG